jgi:hypothetical protein
MLYDCDDQVYQLALYPVTISSILPNGLQMGNIMQEGMVNLIY